LGTSNIIIEVSAKGFYLLPYSVAVKTLLLSLLDIAGRVDIT